MGRLKLGSEHITQCWRSSSINVNTQHFVCLGRTRPRGAHVVRDPPILGLVETREEILATPSYCIELCTSS